VNISPLDIRKHEFKKSLRGFDVDEVISFLDMISMEFENYVRENAMLKEKVHNFEDQLKRYRDIESTLQETLLSAQRAREDTLKNAKKQAEIIVREAEVKAVSIIEDGREELSRLRKAFTELKILKDSYLVKQKALVNAQLEILDKRSFDEEDMIVKNESEDFTKNDIQTMPENSENETEEDENYSPETGSVSGNNSSN